MFDWKRTIERKRARGNQTPGSTKGKRCQATAIDRYMAKSSRSYKHKDYPAWLERMKLKAQN